MSGKCGDKIVLTRKEIRLMKRFFLLETLRVVSMEKITGAEQLFSGMLATMFPGFKEKVTPGETATERWHRNIRVIVETEDLLKAYEHPLCTYDVLRWHTFSIPDILRFGIDLSRTQISLFRISA